MLSRPMIVAHRGDCSAAPESTLPAFRSAIAKGTDAIEFDVHLTTDRELIVHHDTYLGRTEQAEGFIGDRSLAELRSLDVGAWFDQEYVGTVMPTVAEVLSVRNDSVRFEIELRTPDLSLVESVVRLIQAEKLEDRTELTSPHIPLLCQAAQLYPLIRTGLFIDPLPQWLHPKQAEDWIVGWLRLAGAQVAHLSHTMINRSLVDRLHNEGLLVHGADLNTESDMRTATDAGVDQFSTDRLDLALTVRGTTTGN